MNFRWLDYSIAVASLAISAASATAAEPPAESRILTLSNRADLISGGNALVEIKLPLPAPARVNHLKVDLDGADVTGMFGVRPDGRIVGLVTGLKDGKNHLSATSTDKSFAGARLEITNYPISGPILLPGQLSPWICATPAALDQRRGRAGTGASGLSTLAIDAQCNIAREYRYFYRTTASGCAPVLPDPSPPAMAPVNACFKPYSVRSNPKDMAVTSIDGTAVPYIVRVERGTINRGIYDIAVLFDPGKPWSATAPQPQWNGKVIYSFGASTGQPHLQLRSEQNWADDMALSRGFMVVDNSLTDSLYNSNRMLAAETVMMMKEHITEQYGEIIYTAGNGCSGGSIGQNTVASIYPGLLDGIQPACSFPDAITTFTEVTDCVLLSRFYASPAWATLIAGLAPSQVDAKKAAINGHKSQLACHAWYNAFGFINRPGNYTPDFVLDAAGKIGAVPGIPAMNNCFLPPAVVYDPIVNPTGPRCGDTDASANVWGTVHGKWHARSTIDNVGVQYGLRALRDRVITPDEFVTLNERVGGVDADSLPTPARASADLVALEIAYRAGVVTSGKQIAKLAIIDQRGTDEDGIHHVWRSYAERDRIEQAIGNHANHVMWRFGTGLIAPPGSSLGLLALTTMDRWLSALNTQSPKANLNAERTPEQVANAKPADARDFCYLHTDLALSDKVTDPRICDAEPGLFARSSPRQVAGGPRSEDILKCQLKPMANVDYAAITFSRQQWERLQAVFPDGVCDWTKPGVAQQPAISPLNFRAAPGGVPLPAAPTSIRLAD